MSGKCQHAYPNADGDSWCNLTGKDYIEERGLCKNCERRETKCELYIFGHVNTVERISIPVRNATVKRA